jgi:hypothetical protein
MLRQPQHMQVDRPVCWVDQAMSQAKIANGGVQVLRLILKRLDSSASCFYHPGILGLEPPKSRF